MITELTRTEFPRTWEALEKGVQDGVAPGFVAGVWQDREPDQFRIGAVGSRRIEPSRLPMQIDTVFDIASVSKVFATATLAALLVERGWISWETRLSAIFPNYPWREIELQHLLSHTAGFPWWRPLWENVRDRFSPRPVWEFSVRDRQRFMREQAFSIEPVYRVGEKVEYSDISFLLLGFALEEVTGISLDQAVPRYLWEPMGVKTGPQGAHYRRTTRSPTVTDEAVAATEFSPAHQVILQGQVHDENCWFMGGYAGHAGVFARAEDLLTFSRALFRRFLSDRVIQRMWSRMPQPAGCERTAGWDTASGQGSSSGKFFSPRSVGHLGFTGTSLWIDPDARLAVTLLSNRVHVSRDNIAIRKFRPIFHDALRSDLAAR